MTVDRAIKVLKQCIGDCGDCLTCAEHDEAIALAIKGLLVLRSANSLFVGSDALVKEKEAALSKNEMTVAEKIFVARKNANMTQIDAAKRMNVAINSLRLYESGARQPRADVLAKMAGLYGCEVGELICAKERKVEPVADSETIGERIKKARKETKLTQRQLGKKLGVSNVMVSHYELGARKPKIETVKKFAKALGVSAEWLLGGARE